MITKFITKNKFFTRLCFHVVLCLSVLVGCDKTPLAPALTSLPEPNKFGSQSYMAVDDFGRKIILQKPAERIVALSPHVVENLFSAGLGDKIVAAVNYADYPPEAKNIPRVGGFANFSVEAIIAYNPDLVVGWGSGYKGFGLLVERLTALGIAVYIDEPKTMSDIGHSINQLAKLGGTENHALANVNQFERELAALQRKYARFDEKIRVFYQIWPEPLQTLNGNHIVSDVIALCGGKNIFVDAVVLAPTVNIEALLARDPQVIVASASDNQRPKWLDNWQRWPLISAVKNRQLYFVPGDLLSRHTLRMLEGATMLCTQINLARQNLYGDIHHKRTESGIVNG